MIITIFGHTVVKAGMEAAEERLASKVGSVLREMPGFISFKTYHGEDGDEIGIIRFDTREHLDAWVNEGRHGAAQRVAHDYYQSFWVQTAETYREYVWDDAGRADGDLSSLLREPVGASMR
jgi:heme-degrading monooxygenase HmoA